jgi:hypothetical protein
MAHLHAGVVQLLLEVGCQQKVWDDAMVEVRR